MWIKIVLFMILVLMNAFFSGGEIAFISLNSNNFENDNQKSKRILALKKEPTLLGGSIQIAVSFIGIFSGVFASNVLTQRISHILTQLSWVSLGWIEPLTLIVISLVVMFFILVFGKLLPRKIASINPDGFAKFAVNPIYYSAKLLNPLIHFFSLITDSIIKLFGVDPKATLREITEEQIRLLVDTGQIDVEEKMMINNIFEFDNLEVQEIMTHRTDVASISIDSTYDDVMDLVDEERYTRYPVFEENIDTIVGIIHLRDLIRFANSKIDIDGFTIRSIMREAYFVPDTKPSSELFAEMKKLKIHMAIVIDEYGGTAGVVTMEDLIEEVMGNIMDEYDEEEQEFDIQKVSNDHYIVEGSCSLEELADTLDIILPLDDYDTVSGFVIGQMDRLPTLDDVDNKVSEIVFEGYRFKILSIDERVIAQVDVKKESLLEK